MGGPEYSNTIVGWKIPYNKVVKLYEKLNLDIDIDGNTDYVKITNKLETFGLKINNFLCSEYEGSTTHYDHYMSLCRITDEKCDKYDQDCENCDSNEKELRMRLNKEEEKREEKQIHEDYYYDEEDKEFYPIHNIRKENKEKNYITLEEFNKIINDAETIKKCQAFISWLYDEPFDKPPKIYSILHYHV